MTKETKTPGLHSSIDENLKRAYEEMIEEDLPDRFKELLDRLKQQDGGENEGNDE